MADICGFPSSVSDETCTLPAGHPADSAVRFHRFTDRATLVATALRESLEAHEAEITFAYSKGHHYGGPISVYDVVKGMLARLPKVEPSKDQKARWAAEARAGAFADLARELVARWREGVAERTESEIVDAFEALLKEPDLSDPGNLRESGYRLDAMLEEMVMAGWQGQFDAREREALRRLGFVRVD